MESLIFQVDKMRTKDEDVVKCINLFWREAL